MMINHAQGHQMWELRILLDIAAILLGPRSMGIWHVCLKTGEKSGKSGYKNISSTQIRVKVGVIFFCNRYNYGNNMS